MAFKRIDVSKLESFVTESKEAITEFSKIREEFNRINNALMAEWEGSGKSAYKNVTDHIFEKIGSIEAALNEINNNVLTDIIAHYNSLDKDLADYYNNAGKSEVEGNQNG